MRYSDSVSAAAASSSTGDSNIFVGKMKWTAMTQLSSEIIILKKSRESYFSIDLRQRACPNWNRTSGGWHR